VGWTWPAYRVTSLFTRTDRRPDTHCKLKITRRFQLFRYQAVNETSIRLVELNLDTVVLPELFQKYIALGGLCSLTFAAGYAGCSKPSRVFRQLNDSFSQHSCLVQ
jgi:hypothetical protein